MTRHVRVLPFITCLLLGGGGSSASQGSTPSGDAVSGTICLAPVRAPAEGEKSLGNPSGRNPEPDYTVQLDDHQPVTLGVFNQPPPRSTAEWIRSHPEGSVLRGVSFSSHLVIVRHKRKSIASFRFTLEADEPDQCIFLNELYLTWQLWPRSRAPWCKCSADPNH